MKTEEFLRYEAEYRAMQEALGTCMLAFDFPNYDVKKWNQSPPHPNPLPRDRGRGDNSKSLP